MEKSKDKLYVSINMTEVLNSERTFELMQTVGPKVCLLTASHSGFLGYQANLQTGIIPFAGRYGGASLHMEHELNPVRLYQYTMWQNPESHLAFHRENFARVFELCVSCLSVVVAGPWEPVYEVVAASMPPIRSTVPAQPTAQRSVALTKHTVKVNQKEDFEQGIRETMTAIATSPGFLGYMLLRQISVNPLGSLMLDPESMMQLLETLGANPPTDPKPLFESQLANPSPPQYLLHTEWETPERAQSGLDRVLVNHEIRRLYNQRVMPHLIRGPYTMLFNPMMEEPTWRQRLA